MQGPLVDGRPYATDEFLAQAEAYHEAVMIAHSGHEPVELEMPSVNGHHAADESDPLVIVEAPEFTVPEEPKTLLRAQPPAGSVPERPAPAANGEAGEEAG